MPARLRLALFVTGLLAVTAVAGVLLFAVGEKTVASGGFAGSLRPAGIPPADFAGARDERGRPLRLAAMRGKPVVVTFLYTTCEDTCPLTAQQIRIALDELGHDVPVVAVSVDPANDTPAKARTFALKQSMQGRMRWALGSRDQLARVWRSYFVEPQSADSEHSASTILLDARGVQRVGYATSVLTPDDLAHDIALLEREATTGADPGEPGFRPAGARSAAGARGARRS